MPECRGFSQKFSAKSLECRVCVPEFPPLPQRNRASPKQIALQLSLNDVSESGQAFFWERTGNFVGKLGAARDFFGLILGIPKKVFAHELGAAEQLFGILGAGKELFGAILGIPREISAPRPSDFLSFWERTKDFFGAILGIPNKIFSDLGGAKVFFWSDFAKS